MDKEKQTQIDNHAHADTDSEKEKKKKWKWKRTKNEALTEEKQVESEAKTNVNDDVDKFEILLEKLDFEALTFATADANRFKFRYRHIALGIDNLHEFSDENGIVAASHQVKYIGNLLNKCFHNEDGTDLGLKKLRLVLEPRQWTDDQQIEIFYEEEKDESSKRARRQNILSKIISYGITVRRILHVDDDELCIIASNIMEAVKVSEYIMVPIEELNAINIKVNVTVSIGNKYKIADEITVLAKANNPGNMIHIDDIRSSKPMYRLGFVKNIHWKSFDPFLSYDKTINKSRIGLLKTISKTYLRLQSKKERFSSCECVCILPAEDRYDETKDWFYSWKTTSLVINVFNRILHLYSLPISVTIYKSFFSVTRLSQNNKLTVRVWR